MNGVVNSGPEITFGIHWRPNENIGLVAAFAAGTARASAQTMTGPQGSLTFDTSMSFGFMQMMTSARAIFTFLKPFEIELGPALGFLTVNSETLTVPETPLYGGVVQASYFLSDTIAIILPVYLTAYKMRAIGDAVSGVTVFPTKQMLLLDLQLAVQYRIF